MGLPGRREERGKDSHDRTAKTEQFLGELASSPNSTAVFRNQKYRTNHRCKCQVKLKLWDKMFVDYSYCIDSGPKCA